VNNLRVLIYSNPLVVNKISKQFLYWRDSGFIFTKNLLKHFPSNYRVTWVIPDKIKDTSWFTSAHPNVDILPYPYSTSIHQNRYEFYGEVFRKYFPYTTDIDVIINNQPEVSANLRAWTMNQKRDMPLIYSFFHWIDCKESRAFAQPLGGYFWRQFDGALHSDAVYFHKFTGAHKFYEEMIEQGVSDKLSLMTWREFAPPPTIYGDKPMELPNKKIILFNHRLNNTTNWKMVYEIAERIYQDRQDFVLWFTDEGRNLANTKKFKESPFLVVKEIPDESYAYFMKKAYFAVCAHKGYSTWNMAILDTVANGCYTLVPFDGVYVDMLGTAGQYHNFTDLEERMREALSSPVAKLKTFNSLTQSHIYRSLLVPLRDIVNDMHSDILGIVTNAKQPAKYDKVRDYIEEKGVATKRDWVNEFWSFHTNSNFQKIRWSLLLNGFSDNTKEKESTYEYQAPF